MSDNKMEQIREQIFRDNKNAMRIARVPPLIRQRFEELAKADFCDDYGLFLTYLIGLYEKEREVKKDGLRIGQDG